MTQPVSLREAVERSANAVMTGNFMQLMSDITPEALAELMKMAPGAGQFAITAMPAITGYTRRACCFPRCRRARAN